MRESKIKSLAQKVLHIFTFKITNLHKACYEGSIFPFYSTRVPILLNHHPYFNWKSMLSKLKHERAAGATSKT